MGLTGGLKEAWTPLVRRVSICLLMAETERRGHIEIAHDCGRFPASSLGVLSLS